jgi:FAD/FMN-containing dehydrogenase
MRPQVSPQGAKESRAVPAAILKRLRAALGDKGWSDDPTEIAPYLIDRRENYRGQTPLLVRPKTTQEVAEILRICAEAGIAVVPQGGNTGLVGGAVPSKEGNEILLCLSRMNRIRKLDTENGTITAEAGCILAEVQKAAAATDCLFPLRLASEGSCQIGGIISTNAGGNAVLRYGTTRDLVLGLEVVLADGEIWDGLSSLRKDNTGYDLKQLFIGAEGTLGIITAAVLRLVPRPREVETAFIAVPDIATAITLFHKIKAASGETLSACEFIPRGGLEFVLAHIPGTRDPLTAPGAAYLLIELSSSSHGPGELRTLLTDLLARAAEDGLIEDATVASSEAQTAALWRLRESLSDAQKSEGVSIKHDISLPLSALTRFFDEAERQVRQLTAGVRIISFGHLGDGSMHYNLSQPKEMDGAEFLARGPEITRMIHDLVVSLGGSISAEHGIGRLKRDELLRYKSASELRLLRTIKTALDPHCILNPGKTIPETDLGSNEKK